MLTLELYRRGALSARRDASPRDVARVLFDCLVGPLEVDDRGHLVGAGAGGLALRASAPGGGPVPPDLQAALAHEADFEEPLRRLRERGRAMRALGSPRGESEWDLRLLTPTSSRLVAAGRGDAAEIARLAARYDARRYRNGRWWSSALISGVGSYRLRLHAHSPRVRDKVAKAL